MMDEGIGGDQQFVAMLAQTPGDIQIIITQEQIWIEETHFIQRPARQDHTKTDEQLGLDRFTPVMQIQ